MSTATAAKRISAAISVFDLIEDSVPRDMVGQVIELGDYVEIPATYMGDTVWRTLGYVTRFYGAEYVVIMEETSGIEQMWNQSEVRVED